MRQYGLSRREAVGGQPASRRSLRANTPRESFTTDRISIDDQEIAARWFGVACCASPFIIFGFSYLVIRWFS